jgi:predicted secreted hydrolase
MVKLNQSKWLLLGVFTLIIVSTLFISTFISSDHQEQSTNSKSVNRLGSPLGFNSGLFGQQVVADYTLRFPTDHGEHPTFDIEWWYLTANLEDEQGKQYGLQWTLFRFRNPSQTAKHVAWANNQIYMAHASVNNLDSHWFAEKFARGDVGNAGVDLIPFNLYIDNWTWTNASNEATTKQALLPAHLTFQVPLINAQKDHAKPLMDVSITLQQKGPFVLQGNNGYSIKSADGTYASYYYSNPFIDISGQFTFTDSSSHPQTSSPISIKGRAWFDHEWTSQLVDSQTLGWDWLSLHLDDGAKLMAFRMRIQGQADYITGTLVHADGTQTLLTSENLTLVPTQWTEVNQRQLPLIWQVNIPQFNMDLVIKTLKNDQWNPAIVAYYEGMVSVSGSHTGKGFLELTGY